MTLPFTLDGSLDSTPENPDVDFFRFTGAPGSAIQIDLEGAPTGKGTLDDPYLGLFDSGCNLIAISDDNGETLNSRLKQPIPSDGVYILAIQRCCDSSFPGRGNGTYQLTIAEFQAIGSVGGRVVDSLTGNPLPGSNFPYPFVRLLHCENGTCDQDGPAQLTDSDGRFSFERDSIGNLLAAGTYQVEVLATTYSPAHKGPFSVGEDERKDLGDIAITPLPRIHSISGRVVDAITHKSLAGDRDPFTFVVLTYCDPITSDCRSVGQSTDGEGRFSFERDSDGNPLTVGSYSLDISADQYFSSSIPSFDMSEGEDRDVGTIQLQPFPVRLTLVSPCQGIPSSGGTCRYSVRVANGLTTALHGATWSIVQAFTPGTFSFESIFQTGTPRQFQLDPGKSMVVEFSFRVPGKVPNGATICTTAFVSRDQQTLLFNSVAERSLFCITKNGSGSFRVIPQKQAIELIRRTQTPNTILRPR